MICASKLIHELDEKEINQVVVKSLEDRKNRLAEALKLFIAVDNAKGLVTMGELAQFREAHQISPPEFNKANARS